MLNYTTVAISSRSWRAVFRALRWAESVVTCGSGKGLPRSHSANGSVDALDAIAKAVTWRRLAPLTVGEARKLGFEARKAPAR